MRLTLFAVGRMKAGPERELVDRYLDRLEKAGPAVGLTLEKPLEIAESRQSSAALRRREESAQCLSVVADRQAALIVFDERGKALSSRHFADRLVALRDRGIRDVVLAIGGPDGHDTALRHKADLIVSLGAMTWPHQIARLLVAEQLYRTASILAGHPYHRD